MKKIVVLILAVLMTLLLFSACSSKETVIDNNEKTVCIFTDDLGRNISIPENITRIAVTGPLTQIYILPIASDMMVGYANEFSINAQKYIPDTFLNLPALGQLYGGKGTMDLEALLAAAPEVIIDVGEEKANMAEDLDGLSEQTGIPFVHINATVETAPDAYRKLGELLSREEKGEQLAAYLEEILTRTYAIMDEVDKNNERKTLLYCLGDKGTNVLAEKSFHAETLNIVSDNAAKIEDVTPSGDGNEVDLEQIILWNPDVIIFAPESVYSSVENEKTWQMLDAIKSGEYYETPFGPYGWLQSPPAVQRYLGLMWLTSILYPDYCNFALKDEVIEYYKLFYDYDMTDSDYDELMVNALK